MNHQNTAGDSPQAKYAAPAIFLTGIIVGILFFAFYYSNGLTLAHYDAKAHLFVARRMADSIEPGYLQMGSHWLPLAHILYLPFVVFDAQYRSGFLPSLLSVFAFALSVWLIFRLSRRATASTAAGVFAAVLFLANPNLEYLQSCPLTEPLFIVFLLLTVDAFVEWREGLCGKLPLIPAVWSTLGCLCRYEGWYVLGGIVLIIAWDCLSGKLQVRVGVGAGWLYLAMFLLPVGIHFGYLYLSVHDSFLMRVVQGNPVPFETYHRPLLSSAYHLGELSQIAGVMPLLAGLAGVVYCFVQRDTLQKWIPLFLLWLPSLVNVSALYWGMIYRVRYSVILVPAIVIFASLPAASERCVRRSLIFCCTAAAVMPWIPWVFPHEWDYHYTYAGPGIILVPILALLLFLAGIALEKHRLPLLLLCLVGCQYPILAGENRPILEETLEHGTFEPERRQILEYLIRNYDGSRILVDSLKLAPLLYDSHLPVDSFVYNEGNRALWNRTIKSPQSEVGWICILQGDELSSLLGVDPHLVDGYALVSKTNSLSLFRLKQMDR